MNQESRDLVMRSSNKKPEGHDGHRTFFSWPKNKYRQISAGSGGLKRREWVDYTEAILYGRRNLLK
jgi:hypothetical protein